MKKIRVGILFGGRSGEHEVSLLSAASVLQAIDRSKFEVIPVGITKQGQWVTAAHAERLLSGEPAPSAKQLRAGDPAATSAAAVLRRGESVIVPPVPATGKSGSLVPFEQNAHSLTTVSPDQVLNLDVVFGAVDGLEDGGGGEERDFMLATASAKEDADTDLFHGPVAIVNSGASGGG